MWNKEREAMLKKIYGTLIQIICKGYWAFFAAACIVLALFCFYHLDVKYVDSWDEARHGVNAYEMIQNNNYIQHTFNYEVDDWNLKPSLSYWGILLGFGIFGYGVLGLRFYSALCYFLTGIVTSLFVRKKTRVGSILVLGFFCANTLPLYAHLARAGDADSLYLMLFTFAMLAMLQIPKNKKWLPVCGLCFSLAFLTKSWHAGMIAVIGGLYLLLTGEIRKIPLKQWIWFLLGIFVPLILWFGWRYQADGFTFLKQMIQVDLLARTGTDNFEGHSYPFSFYWEMVFGNTAYIYPWIVGICAAGAVCGVAWLVWKKKRACGNEAWTKENVSETGISTELSTKIQMREVWALAVGLILWFSVPFLGFSLMKTKLIWYCYPALIPLFVAAAIFVGWVLEYGSGAGKAAKKEKSVKEENTKEENTKEETAALKETEEQVEYMQKIPMGRFMPQVCAAGQILLTAGCIVLTAHFMQLTYETAIRDVHGDGFQDFLQMSASQDCAYAGRDAYIQVAGEKPEQLGDWDQNRLFLAEISGNFRCKDGGVEAFLEDPKNGVLYIDQENYVLYQEQLEGCTTLYMQEGYPYVLVEK